jgi:thioredoxin-related protein
MIKHFLLPALFFLFTIFSIGQVAIGSSLEMSRETLQNANGSDASLVEETKRNGIVLVFSCNTCPFVVGSKHFPGWENQYNELHKYANSQDVGFVLVNSNEAKRTGDDSFKAMQIHAKNVAYNMSYLLDKNATLANSLKAKTTPHVFFFDQNQKLVYSGSIDNIWDGKRKKTKPFLRSAIENHLKSKKIKPNATAPKGCSIKRIKA